jgi:hypothetical protein
VNEYATRASSRPEAANRGTETILVPLDVGESAVDALAFVNGLAAQRRVTIVLLHVINLNILAPESRVYLELEREALAYLEGIADRCLPASRSTVIRIRYGHVGREISAEAREQGAKWIVLRAPKPRFWVRVVSRLRRVGVPWPQPSVQRVLQARMEKVR